MKAWHKIAVGGLAVIGGASAPVIPTVDTSKHFLMAQEIVVSAHVPYQPPSYVSTTTGKTVTPPAVMDDVPNFPDTDGDGKIYVASFETPKGTEYKELTQEQYQKMGQKDGYSFNPTVDKLDSLIDVLTPHADAAIAISSNSASQNASANGATSETFAYTGTGTQTYLVVTAADFQGDTVTGVTYAAVAMSQLAKVSRGPTNVGSYETYIYGLAAPTTGSNNVVISRSGTTNWVEGGAVLLTGAQQTTAITTSVATQGASTGASKSQAITTTSDNSAVIGMMLNDNGSLAASTGDTQLYIGATGKAGNGNMIVRSTTFPYTPAGTLTMNWTQNSTGAWGVMIVEIDPPSLPKTVPFTDF